MLMENDEVLISKKSGGLPLYQQLATRLSRLIEKGTWRPGEKVPSIRRMTQTQKVSPATVLQAYTLLEADGWIEARPQSGFYVKSKPKALLPAPTRMEPTRTPHEVKVCELAERVFRDANEGIEIPLGCACPDPKLLPNDRILKTLTAEARRLGAQANTYSFPPGYEKFRREVSRRAIDFGVEVAPEEVVVTAGAVEAIHLSLLAVAARGDLIAVEAPTYFGALQSIQSLGMRALEIASCPGEGISLSALKAALGKYKISALFLMSNAQNPLGVTMPEENKKKLVEMLAEHGVPLIEDDVNGDVYFGEERPKVCKSFDTTGNVLLCNSYSKTVSPGLRVGWILAGRYRRQIENLKFVTSAGTSLLAQATIAEFLKNGGYDRHLRSLRKSYFAQMNALSQGVAQHFPEGTKLTRPAGGSVLWIELPEGTDSLKIYTRALEKGISFCPGPLFSANAQFRNYMRLSSGMAYTPKMDDAIRTLGKLARTESS